MVKCAGRQRDGRQCGAPPIRGERFCLLHSPDRAEDAAEARRLGGLRRRREKTVSGAHDFEGLDSVAAIRRILEIAVLDSLGLGNSLARSRTLIAAAQAATRLLESGELEARITSLDAALEPTTPGADRLRGCGMTMARRLSRLESSLPPKATVLHWLDEAHTYPTLSAYVAWLVTQSRDAFPQVGVPERVEEAALGWGGPETERIVRDAVSDAVFLVHLALGVAASVDETLRTEGLRAAALTWWMRAPSCAGADALVENSSWPAWREVAELHAAELRQLNSAVGTLADRYLDGRDCLFPATRAEWDRLRGRAGALQGIGAEMASSAETPASEVRVTTADERVGTLVAHARAEAMDTVGRPQAAMAILVQYLRARMGVA